MKHLAGASIAFTLAAAALASPPSPQAPSLDDVLKRAREAVARYEEQAALLLADEQCDQKAFESTLERTGTLIPVRVDPRGRRKWRAELAMVRTPQMAEAGSPWMEFRDVVAVDGQPLADRTERLSHLFLEQPEWSLERARQIAEEGARFNVGPLKRTINTPAVPLLVLHPANGARFSFEKLGEETLERVRAWKVGYREGRTPTLISAGEDYCPAEGTVWLDPATGEVARAILRCAPLRSPDYPDEITVTYRRDPRFGLRVPAEMLERPGGPSPKASYGQYGRSWVEARCTYSNFRRFETAAKMISPR